MKVNCRILPKIEHDNWPSELPCLPNIGNVIEARWEAIRLEVVAITFEYNYQEEKWIPYIDLDFPK